MGWQLVTTVWIWKTPHQLGASVPAIIVLTHTPRCMYPWYLFLYFLLGTALMFGFLNCRNVLIHPILDLPLLHISEKLSHSESAVIEAKKVRDTWLLQGSVAWHVFASLNQRTIWVPACHVIYSLSIYANLLSVIAFTDFMYSIYTNLWPGQLLKTTLTSWITLV